MFTNTGIQDKKFIHLSQFVGLFIRPEKFLEEAEDESLLKYEIPIITNGH